MKEVMEQKKLKTVYVCKNCYHDLSEAQSVMCEHCLCWFHMKCVGLLKEPKAKYWYCWQCHASPADTYKICKSSVTLTIQNCTINTFDFVT